MADELQALLDRISDEELKKTETKCNQIIADAKRDADNIKAEAQSQAEEIIANAQSEAARLQEKGMEALKQASRDLLISLKGELQKRMAQATENLMTQQTSGTTLADILVKVILGFKKSDGTIDDIQVLLSPAELETVQAYMKQALSADLLAHCQLNPVPGINGGFKLVFKENAVVYDFTDASLAESLCAFLAPKLAAVFAE